MTAHVKPFDFSADNGSELRTLAAELLYAAADFGDLHPEAAETLRGAAYELERLATFGGSAMDFPIADVRGIEFAFTAKN
jgi:hypothetical protein